MSEASKLHIIDDNTLPSTGWKKHWDLIRTSRFLHRKVWVMWTTSSPGWLPLNQSKCVGCSVGLLVSLCSLQPHLLGSTLCYLAVLVGWFWPFRICGTKWTKQLPTLHAGLPHANTELSWDVGRFGDGSWKNYHSWYHVLPVSRLLQMNPKADWQISISGLSELELILWVVQKTLGALWTCNRCRRRIVQM